LKNFHEISFRNSKGKILRNILLHILRAKEDLKRLNASRMSSAYMRLSEDEMNNGAF
jgi:hypothetical protein